MAKPNEIATTFSPSGQEIQMAKKSTKPAKTEEVEDQDEEGQETAEDTEDDEGAEGDDGTAATTETKKKKVYETMIVGVAKGRKPLREQLENLASTLGCKISDLIWYGVEQTLKNPPKAAPAGSAGNVGSASGFWTAAIQDGKGRATGVKVVEVESRGDFAGGRAFFRFKKGDDKERARAKAQAVRAAQSDAGMIGFKGDISIEEVDAA